ncbi:NAD(P)-binding domain-containing protein [Pseudoruegeria sp. HB172150]|uniref:NAD(P)-binding domain-containing protein n=1 Tax=Pseudoruegeria sp. HB172150 TaxID=2721164 RepID=UPI001556D7EA|nr:NAD(P)-binding domain-containing protein [Pseudoruegeria sp. HB172150]
MTITHLDDDTLAGLGLTTEEIVEAIEDTVRGIAAGTLSAAPKTAVTATDGRYMMATLAASDDAGVIAVKAVQVNDRNKASGLPAINGAIMLLDSETGALVATMGSNWITGVRTAGLSATAARRLADPNSRTLGLIGAGVQGESHLRAFKDLYPLEHVRIYSRSQPGIDKLAAIARDLGLSAERASAKDTISGADIVVSSVTLDHSIAPFLDARWLKPGGFAAITDLGIPWEPEGQKTFGRLYVDDLAQEKTMPKPLAPAELIDGDLIDLVTKGAEPADGPSAFVFRGISAGDLAVAALAWKRAKG